MFKFSIIIAAYNCADRIRKTLDSIKAQTFRDYELIVVCDACRDNTAEIAREYTDKVFEVWNNHPGPTRNVGLDYATGEWIMIVDDDDWLLHEFVLEQLAEHLGDEDVLNFAFVWKNVGVTMPVRPNGCYWPAGWSRVIRRTALGDIRYPRQTPEDLIFINRLLSERILKIKNWDMPLYYYNYMRPGSITDTLNKQGLEPDLRRKKNG